jgi:spore maturation protein SpmA
MEFEKIEKSKKPAMVVLVSIVASIIVLLAGVLGMGILSRHRLRYGFWPKRVELEPARNRRRDLLAD